MVDELLTMLRESGFQVYGYADMAIVTRGNFLTIFMNKALIIM